MKNVRDHPYVLECDEARPIIIEAMAFLCDLDRISTRVTEVQIFVYIFYTEAIVKKMKKIKLNAHHR